MNSSRLLGVLRLITPVLLVTYSLLAAGADCVSTTPIGSSQTITASLDGTECTVDDLFGNGDLSYYDFYRLTLASATRLTITMESNAFDTYLELYTEAILTSPGNPAAYIAENDDAGSEATDSRITINLQPGNYIIVANSFNPSETGPYTLTTVSTPSAGNCSSTTPIGSNQKILAGLDGSECLVNDFFANNDFTFYDLYQLTLDSAGTVTITLDSSAIDSYLLLYSDAILNDPDDPDAFIALNDDATENNTNSKITVALEPGNYIIFANTFWEYETGAYVLETVTFTGSKAMPWIPLLLE